MSPIDLRSQWLLDPTVTFLNHGSFGACPEALLNEQRELERELERDPVFFMLRKLPARLDAARERLANFIGADSNNLVFVPNATAGVNTVLRSLKFEADDELLTTNHAYGACVNALAHAGRHWGARVVTADVPYPIATAEHVVDAVLSRVTPRTKLALLDHVTSPTGLVFPVARLVRELEQRGICTIVDGAHAIGMLPLELETLGASFYAGNCHKWLCSPKAAGLLYVAPRFQKLIDPLIISHELPIPGRSSFLNRFAWNGTFDPTPYLCAARAIDWLAGQHPLGWPGIRQRNRELTLRARDLVCSRLDLTPPAPDDMLGFMASIPLPDDASLPAAELWFGAPLQHTLRDRYQIEIPVFAWPKPPKRVLRLSAHLYNSLPDYEKLASALQAELCTL